MSTPAETPRQQYQAWIEEQLEDYKAGLTRDELLDRVLFRPYATEPAEIGPLDPVAALNPWQRMGVDIVLNVPRTLRLIGSPSRTIDR